MKLDRRLFLKSGLALLPAVGIGAWYLRHRDLSLTPSEPEPLSGVLLNSHYYVRDLPPRDRTRLRWTAEFPSEMVRLDLKDMNILRSKTPFYLHQVIPLPRNPDLALGCMKWGQKAGVVSVSDASLQTVLTAPPEFRFFGHTRFTADGQYALMSANSNDDRQGLVLIYDAADFRLVEKVPTDGRFPHDMMLLDEHTLLIGQASPTNDDPSMGRITTLDLRSLRPIRHAETPKSDHFNRLSPTAVLVGGHNYDAARATWFTFDTEKFEVLNNFVAPGTVPDDLPRGEALSFGSLGSGTLVTTTSNGGNLLFWNQQTGARLVHKMPFSPNGILIHQEKMLVAGTPSGRMMEIDFDSREFKVIAEKEHGSIFGNGSHFTHLKHDLKTAAPTTNSAKGRS